MKAATVKFWLRLPAGRAAMLGVVADATGQTAAELAAEVLGSWLGPVMAREDRLADRRAVGIAADREEAARRLAILQGWWKARERVGPGGKEAASRRYLMTLNTAKGMRLSRGTLYGWERRYRVGGLDGLIDGRIGGRPDARFNPFLEELAKVMREGRRPAFAAAYRGVSEAARAKRWAVPSAKTAKRFITGERAT